VILIFNLLHRVTTTKKTVFKLEQCLGEDMLLYRMEKNGLCCKKYEVRIDWFIFE
jgi:hypothetical protein